MKDVVRELKIWLYPPVSAIGADEPDLSMYGDELEGMLARYKALRGERNERAAHVKSERDRVQQLLLPYAQDIVELLKRARLSPSVSHGSGGFAISLYIHSIPGIRETKLRLSGGIHIGDDGRATFMCSSNVVTLDDASQEPKEYELWNDSATFLLGGSEEQSAIDKVFAELKAQLQGFVEQMFATAKGEEPTPTQSQEI